ncbi:hypothetical protein CRG98_014774, partial [Punica granatum]
RITIEQIRNDEWFKKGYVPVRLLEYEDVNLDDVNAAFDDDERQKSTEETGNEDLGPLILNAFDLIILSQGLNLSTLFDRGQDSIKYQTRFITQKPVKVVLSSMEVVAQSMGFKTHIRNYKVFEVAPTFFMVDIQKAAGDATEYLKAFREIKKKMVDSHVMRQEGHPVAYYSEKLNEAKKKYSTYDLELYAIFQAVKF